MSAQKYEPALRRWRIVGAAVAVVVVMVVGIITAVVAFHDGSRDTRQALWGGPTTPSVTSTAVESASASPSTAATPTSTRPTTGATTAPTGTPTPGGRGADEGPTMSPAERLEDCKWSVRVTSVWTDGWVGVEWGDHEACPPEAEGWVFWASYAMNHDGSGLLFDWHEYRLSDSHRQVDFFIHTPPSCQTWFVVRGNVALKSTLSAAQMHSDGDPYGGNSLHYNIDKNCQVD